MKVIFLLLDEKIKLMIYKWLCKTGKSHCKQFFPNYLWDRTSADTLRCKMKSTRQIMFSWSLYVYFSEDWKCLFLRYKTDMHKSISESSKEGTDRPQKVYVGGLSFFQRSMVLRVVYGVLPFALSSFSLEEERSICSSDKYFWNKPKCPSKGCCGPNSGSSPREAGGMFGERRWVPGLMPEGKWQCSPRERSHDLHYVLAAAEAGAPWMLASREFGITLWITLKQSLL